MHGPHCGQCGRGASEYPGGISQLTHQVRLPFLEELWAQPGLLMWNAARPPGHLAAEPSAQALQGTCGCTALGQDVRLAPRKEASLRWRARSAHRPSISAALGV